MNRQSFLATAALLVVAPSALADFTYNWQYRWVAAKLGAQSPEYICAPSFDPWEAEILKKSNNGFSNTGYGYQKSSLNPDGVALHGFTKATGGNLGTSGEGYTFLNVEFTIDEQTSVHLGGVWDLEVGSQGCGYEATIDLNSGDKQLFLWSRTDKTHLYEEGVFPFEFDALLDPGSYQFHAYLECRAGGAQGAGSVGLDALLTAPAPATAAGFVTLAACARRRRPKPA